MRTSFKSYLRLTFATSSTTTIKCLVQAPLLTATTLTMRGLLLNASAAEQSVTVVGVAT